MKNIKIGKRYVILFLMSISLFVFADVVFLGGFPADVNYITIYTPNGSTVLACQSLDELSSSEKAELRNNALLNYRNITILDNPTLSYNCHGYAWSMTDGGPTCWLGDDGGNLSQYWGDGSFYETDLQHAERIVYDYQAHSAVNANDGKFISKWGASVLVKHVPSVTPYAYNNPRFYAKTPEVSGHRIISSSRNQTYQVGSIPSGLTLSWNYDTNLFTRVSSSGTRIVLKAKNSSVSGSATVTARFLSSSGVEKGHTFQTVYVNRLPPVSVNLRVIRSSDGAEVYPSGTGLSPNTYYYAYISGADGYNISWQPDSHIQVLDSSNSMMYFKTDSQGWTLLNIFATDPISTVSQRILGVTLYGGY